MPAAARVDVSLAVHGDHQVSNALCAAAVALECGAASDQVGRGARRRRSGVAAADAGQHPRRRRDDHQRRLQRQPGLDARRPQGAGLDGASGRREAAAGRCSGEMAELGDDAISEHDRIGRLAVRLDVSRLIVVGSGRPMSAMLHGAVMEGSWGSEATAVADADAALALLRAELRAGDVVLVKASNSAGLGALADALAADARRAADEADPDRRRDRAGGVDPADPGADQAVHPAGLRPRDPRGRPAQPPQEARHPVDGRRGDRRRHLGQLFRHPSGRCGDRRQGPVGVGSARARAGHRARARAGSSTT